MIERALVCHRIFSAQADPSGALYSTITGFEI
jgi:hypothetical protein